MLVDRTSFLVSACKDAREGSTKFYLFTSALSDVARQIGEPGVGVDTLVRKEDTLGDVAVG